MLLLVYFTIYYLQLVASSSLAAAEEEETGGNFLDDFFDAAEKEVSNCDIRIIWQDAHRQYEGFIQPKNFHSLKNR